MPVLGITGGIATGKSTFTRLLLRHLPAEAFDADRVAHELLEADSAVRFAVEKAFGRAIYGEGSSPNRVLLRELIFSDQLKRKQLEEILHPAIRARWTVLAANVSARRGRWLFVDLPLLYETAAETHFDRVIVVACSPATQQRRLQTERALTPELADGILAAQLDLRLKSQRADHLIWNDSTLACLDGQADLLTRWLRQRYD